jgi:ATP-dependent RNA helicase DeaD
MLNRYRPHLAGLFCRTQIRVRKLAASLQERGFNADELHGGLTQAQREDVMRRFREGSVQLLVATDVAARGLDIEGVTHVFNYDIPHDGESYIHRIGRTGRAGQRGYAFTLAAPRDEAYLQAIERAIGTVLEKKRDSEYRDGVPKPTAMRQMSGAAQKPAAMQRMSDATPKPAAMKRMSGAAQKPTAMKRMSDATPKREAGPREHAQADDGGRRGAKPQENRGRGERKPSDLGSGRRNSGSGGRGKSIAGGSGRTTAGPGDGRHTFNPSGTRKGRSRR